MSRDLKLNFWFLLAVLATLIPQAEGQVLNPKFEFRGMWVATVNNIDWPSRPGLPVEQQKKEITEMLDMHQRLGMNAVILQIRPCSDAFYPSLLEPWSRYLTGIPGMPPFPFYDPLQCWIEECHKRHLELHAWLNPYRIAQHADEPLAGNHEAFKHPDWVIKYDDKLLFDPGIPGTRDYVCNVVCDILRRYDVDGIHMDDYFYPYPTREPFPDDKSFALYNRAFSREDKAAWRRENVDILIKMINDSIKAIKPWVKFGISPFGIWRNRRDDPDGSNTTAGVTNYDDLYADIRKWLQNGWIDYVTPQIYFEIGHRAADFETLCRWWNDNTFGKQLYIGLAAYKINPGSTVEAWKNPRQLPDQLKIMKKFPNISGCIYFNSKKFKDNLLGFQDSLIHRYYASKALTPPIPLTGKMLPLAPQKVTVSGRKVIWQASASASSLITPVRYILYLCEPGKVPDPENPASIVKFTDNTRAEFRKKGKRRKPYEIRISTIDRFNRESPLSDPVTIKL